jgi:hypothetical protein
MSDQQDERAPTRHEDPVLVILRRAWEAAFPERDRKRKEEAR